MTSVARPQSRDGSRRRTPTPLRWDFVRTIALATSLTATSITGSTCGQEPDAVTPGTLDLFPLPPVDQTTALCLSAAEQTALVQNPSLAQAAARVQAARGRWLQVGLWPDPIVSVGQQQTGSEGLAEQDYVGVGQDFVTAGKLRLNRAVAASEIARAEQDHRSQQNRVLTDVRVAFYDLLIAQRQLTVAQELVGIAEQGVTVAKTTGIGSGTERNDVLEATVELHSAQIVARKAANRVLAAQTNLLSAMGETQWRYGEITGEFNQWPVERRWQPTLDGLLGHSPELAASLAQQEQSRWSLERAQAGRIPNVTVQGLVNWRDNGIGGRPDGGFQVSVPLPIWDANQGNIVSAQADVIAAARALESQQLDLQQRLAVVFEKYANARQEAQQYRDYILPAAREALVLTVQNYEAGKVEYDDVLTSQRTNASANITYLDALRDLWTAEFEIEGMLLSNSLAPQPQ